MSDEKTARYYEAGKNPEGGMLPGVPLRDLTESEFAALPDWLQRSVDASPFYRKTRPPQQIAPTNTPEE
jgi:hypothetical protein